MVSATSTRVAIASGASQVAASSLNPCGEGGFHRGWPRSASVRVANFGLTSRLRARAADHTNSCGVLSFRGGVDQASGELISANVTALRSPRVLLNTAA